VTEEHINLNIEWEEFNAHDYEGRTFASLQVKEGKRLTL